MKGLSSLTASCAPTSSSREFRFQNVLYQGLSGESQYVQKCGVDTKSTLFDDKVNIFLDCEPGKGQLHPTHIHHHLVSRLRRYDVKDDNISIPGRTLF
jgi:hypothetical protein